MKYLKDIKCSKIEDPKGFKLEFFFDTNPFFKNSVLMKTYHMVDEDDPILEKAIGLVFLYSVFYYISKFTRCSIDVKSMYAYRL